MAIEDGRAGGEQPQDQGWFTGREQLQSRGSAAARSRGTAGPATERDPFYRTSRSAESRSEGGDGPDENPWDADMLELPSESSGEDGLAWLRPGAGAMGWRRFGRSDST